MGLLTMDDGIVNWGEHTEAEETNHALMAISSSNEVTLCSKTCIDSYNTLKTLCDEQMNQLGDQEAQILAYSQAVKKLEKKEAHFEGSCRNTSEHSFETESESLSEPNEMSKSRLEVTNEKDVSAPKSKEVEPSCVSHIKTPRQPLKDKETHKVNRKNWNDMMERELGEGYSFTKKKCFVCGSLSHLIKDCDYYEKKMAREAEVKRVVNTGNGVAKPVWTNANRVNHANKFVPRSVQLNTGRTNINSVRPKVNAVSPKVNAVSPKVNTVRPRQPVPHKTSNSLSPKRPQMNQINQRRDFSKSYSSVRRPFAKSTAQMAHSNAVIGKLGNLLLKPHKLKWRNSRPNFKYNSRPIFIKTVNANGPQGRPKPAKAWVLHKLQVLIASEEKDEEVELIVVPSAVKIPEEKVELRTSSINSKKEETLTEPQKEDKDSSTNTLKDNPKIQALNKKKKKKGKVGRKCPKAFRDSP
ncbi:hypothetical protein Tco_0255662 [Tanacetum coccineum]